MSKFNLKYWKDYRIIESKEVGVLFIIETVIPLTCEARREVEKWQGVILTLLEYICISVRDFFGHNDLNTMGTQPSPIY